MYPAIETPQLLVETLTRVCVAHLASIQFCHYVTQQVGGAKQRPSSTHISKGLTFMLFGDRIPVKRQSFEIGPIGARLG